MRKTLASGAFAGTGNTKMMDIQPQITIKPHKGWLGIDFKELWEYRELAYFFVWRDLKIRYKQTAVGVLWAVFQPLASMVIFTVFFGRFARMPSDGIPYPIFVYTGLLLWNYFAFGLSHASSSMLANSGVIQKIYFPRLIIPLSSSLIGLLDFCVASTILAGMMFYYHYIPSFSGVLCVPFLLIIIFLSSVGIGCFLASVNVKYRDVQYVLPFFIQMFMFLTPVIYPVSILEDKYRWVTLLNPVAVTIEVARDSLLKGRVVDWGLLSLAFLVAAALFVFGTMYFRKTERYFADII